jgi:hypothetical protein
MMMNFKHVYALQVKWANPATATWTKTEARGMTAHQLADQLLLGSTERCGSLAIPELFVPPGFSGGAAYFDVPATVLSSGASATDPGILHLSSIWYSWLGHGCSPTAVLCLLWLGESVC